MPIAQEIGLCILSWRSSYNNPEIMIRRFKLGVGEGLAFGTGIAVAFRVVDNLLGPRSVQHECYKAGPHACTAQSNLKALQECLDGYDGTSSNYKDILAECRRKSGSINTPCCTKLQ